MEQQVIFSVSPATDAARILRSLNADRIFILTDTHTSELCLPILKEDSALGNASVITIKAGDGNKNLQSCAHVWQHLVDGGSTRKSVLICLGGGMVTDLGGFAASTFKRGIRFVNIPTTLLAMVDAAVGGKTGVNFGGLKNEIGVFSPAQAVILSTRFLATLPQAQLLSGYAEMLKHGLLSDTRMWAELLNFDIVHPDLTRLQVLLQDSVKVKQHIVEQDPQEQHLRKALNLGHTVGHAMESLFLKREQPIEHGYAVAAGLVAELYLSAVKKQFPTEQLRQTVGFIVEHYGRLPITCDDYPELLQLMKHDKKNTGNDINFTLLHAIAGIDINQTASEEEIEAALDFYREGV